MIREVIWLIIFSVLDHMMINGNRNAIFRTITIVTALSLLLICFTGTCLNGNSVYAQNMTKERGFPNAQKAKDEEPVTLGSAACLIDAKSGYMVYGVDEHERNYPASTTKVMTALLAIENLELTQEITVDSEAADQGGSQLYLSQGEILTTEELLYGMMLPSANDAAVVLGKAMAQTTAEFADMMNEKAKSLGAEDTNFVNPNGLPDDNHYTSAYDLALIAKEALKYEEFRKIVTTYEYTMKKTNLSDKRLIHNRNRLLYNINRKVEVYGETKSIKYEGVTGIKTGYTDKAKFCLVGSAEREGTEFIAVTMKSEDMNGYQDVISMLDYGFNNYKTVEVKTPGSAVDDVQVSGGKEKYAEAVVAQGLYATIPADASENEVSVKTNYDQLEAPYEGDITAGTIEVYYNDEKVGEADVTVISGMDEGNYLDDFFTGSGVMGIFKKLLILLTILIFAVIILRIINKSARRRALRRKREIKRKTA